jgi:hypothetical protein
LCGKAFEASDEKNGDHLPPKSIFHADHRDDPLILPTHTACNNDYRLVDEKIGQLIAHLYEKIPRGPERLKISRFSSLGLTAVTNLDIDGAIWRWISGFHAALYREPATDIRDKCSLVTPFPKAQIGDDRIVFDPIKPQHHAFVQAIKDNRARENLDEIRCNKGKCVYQCVWQQAVNNGLWMCFFALNLYDWKDLGKTKVQPARGCAGCYVLSSGAVLSIAARAASYNIIAPNYDSFDPFAS